MSKVTVRGVSLEYVEQGQGEPVVFVHGSASDYRTWQGQLSALSERFRAIAYSRRYHHPNPPIEEGVDYSMAEHVEDLKAVLNGLEVKPAHLVGHSYGALVALLLAMRAPDYVQTLSLAEPPAITLFVSSSPKLPELLKLLFERPRTALAIIRLGATGLGPAAAAARKDDMEEAMRLFGTAALGRETFNRMPEERKEQVRVNLTKAEFLGSGFLPLEPHRVREVNVPTLLLTAQSSPRVFHRLADCLEAFLPDTERTEISNASHIMQEDNAAEFSAKVIYFLDKHRLRA